MNAVDEAALSRLLIYGKTYRQTPVALLGSDPCLNIGLDLHLDTVDAKGCCLGRYGDDIASESDLNASFVR